MKTAIGRRSLVVALLVGSVAAAILLSDGPYGPRDAEAGQPDLTVDASEVWVTPHRALAGEGVTLKAIIRNISAVDAEDVSVQFEDYIYAGDEIVVVGSETVDVPANGIAIAEITWGGDPGNNDIFISIDPDDAIAESNEGNNQATARIFVSPVTGDVNCKDGVNVVDSLAILRWDAGLDYNILPPCPVIGD